MMVRTARGRKGDVICEIDGALCLFPHRIEQPLPDQDIEVMITHHARPVYPEGYFEMTDAERADIRRTIAFLFVAPVTCDHVLVSHRGFECSGSMCRTTADVDENGEAAVNARIGRRVSWLTPGRSPVVEVSNVNVGWHGQKRCAPIPGAAYVSLADLRQGLNRICGLPDLSQVDPLVLAMLRRRGRRDAA